MKFIYNTGVYLMGMTIRLAGLFNPKAKLWASGRKGLLHRMAETIDPTADIAWFHASSLGEFEQGRPVIEELRKRCPDLKILVTFFSPSGYEIRKNYQGADYIFYLPNDTPRNVKKFMQIVHPKIAVFIKYEFWVNYLMALKKNGSKVYIISSIFRPDQSFFKWYGGIFRKALRCFNHIFVQNEQSKELLKSISINNVSVTGDTRFDRVFQIAAQSKDLPEIARFAKDKDVFIAGSTWPPDEQLLIRLINDYTDIKFIIAPHEIEQERIDRLIEETPRKCLKYTCLNADSDLQNADILFIDTIGILSSVYKYGKYGYIGGGFGVGIHNILEAATFGLPLAFGPKYKKFKEAVELVENGGATAITSYEELSSWLTSLKTNPVLYDSSSAVCYNYVRDNKGATAEIINEICR